MRVLLLLSRPLKFMWVVVIDGIGGEFLLAVRTDRNSSDVQFRFCAAPHALFHMPTLFLVDSCKLQAQDLLLCSQPIVQRAIARITVLKVDLVSPATNFVLC